MESLAEMKCIPAKRGEPSLTEIEIEKLQPQVPDWQITDQDGIKQLFRTYNFKNFSKALNFTNQVGEISEEQDHHPVLVTEWGKVTVTWWTHVIGDLHINDFIMAAKSDQEFETIG